MTSAVQIPHFPVKAYFQAIFMILARFEVLELHGAGGFLPFPRENSLNSAQGKFSDPQGIKSLFQRIYMNCAFGSKTVKPVALQE